QSQMSNKKLIIADGHHRYETALAYREEMERQKGSDRIPMTFFNMHSPGLTILPTHRVLSNLPGFDPAALFERPTEFFDLCRCVRLHNGVFTRCELVSLKLKTGLDPYRLMPDISEKQRGLDVVILHRLILERCMGITEEAVKKESYITYV